MASVATGLDPGSTARNLETTMLATRLGQTQALQTQAQHSTTSGTFSKAQTPTTAVQAKITTSQNLFKTPEPIAKVRNTLAQTGRVIGGIAQGTMKVLTAPAILKEGLKPSGTTTPKLTPQRYTGGASRKDVTVKGANVLNGQEMSVNIKRLENAPTNTQVAATVNNDVEKWTNSWVPAPQSGAAEVAAKLSDIVGEAVPVTAAAVLGGATTVGGVLTGNVLSYAAGGAQALSSEMLEGSGNIGNAAIKAGTAVASEAIGGKTFDVWGGKIGGAVGKAVGIIGEGLEENIDGALYSAATGDKYTAKEALQDFLYGTAAGGILSSVAGAVNSINAKVVNTKINAATDKAINDIVKTDVGNLTELVTQAGTSTAAAIVAEDSVKATQLQTANPLDIPTKEIPSAVVEKYNLKRSGDAKDGTEIKLTVPTYETRINPLVTGIETPTVDLTTRATANPNTVGAENPRALYKYAEGIYLKPGTDVEGGMFTYRGQPNQFYGSLNVSGVGTSFEGKGVYSALDTYTSDLYGASGKLPDNPYRNSGIPKKTVDVDYPIGVVLRQDANLKQETSPLTFHDAPGDVVQEGTRRVRYAPEHGFRAGAVTEVVNNINDVDTAGMIFTRSTVEQATPITYGLAPDAVTPTMATGESNRAQSTTTPTTATNGGASVNTSVNENITMEAADGYRIPNVLNVESLGVNAGSGRGELEQTTIRTTPESATLNGTENTVNIGTEQAATEKTSDNLANDFTNAVQTATTAVEEYSGLYSDYAGERLEVPIRSDMGALSGTFTPDNFTNAVKTETTVNAKAAEIWTPLQAQQNNRESDPEQTQNPYRYREHKNPGSFGISRGNGNTGRIFETIGYNKTFGI